MNPLRRLKKFLRSNRSNWNIRARQLIDEVDKYELGVDYQTIDKVECFPSSKTGHLWGIHINGELTGAPIYGSAYAKQVADWLNQHRANFSLVKNAPKHTND